MLVTRRHTDITKIRLVSLLRMDSLSTFNNIKLTTIVYRLDKRRKKQNKTKGMWCQYMGKDKGERKKKHATR